MADYGHEATEKLIEEAEKRIRKEYQQATAEVKAKLDDYFRLFEIKDKAWQKMVANGEKTQAEYLEWRKGQLMVGKRWEELKDTLAEDLHKANLKARNIANGYRAEAYALNHNYATFQVEKGAMVDTSYTLYNRFTVEKVIKEEPELLPAPGAKMKKRLAEGKDIAWQKGQLQSVTLQSILQGESIPDMAKRIAKTMGESDHKATIRYARTTMTSAQNAGRLDAYQRASDMGIKMKKTWVATLDSRTRHDHRVLDGQTVDIDKPFVVNGRKIMSPGDPSADADLIWNCRCTMIAQIDGFERDITDLGLRHNSQLGNMSYEEWKKGHGVSQTITKQEEIAEGMKGRTINELYKKKESNNILKTNSSKKLNIGSVYDRHTKRNGLNRANYAELSGKFGEIVSSNLDKLPKDVATIFENTVQKLAEKYDTPLQKVRTMTEKEALFKKDSFAFVTHNYSVDSAELVINPVKCKDEKKLVERITELSKKNYCIPIKEGLEKEYIVTHEFAHTIVDTKSPLDKNFVGADFKKIKKARKEIESLYAEYANTVGTLSKQKKDLELIVITEENAEKAKAAADSAREIAKTLKEKTISQYSLLNADEFMAESFALNEIGAKENEYAKKAVDIIKKYFLL